MSTKNEQYYKIVYSSDVGTYEGLKGPDGFQCWLTEPEDRSWDRDLDPVVRLLNSQYVMILKLKDSLLNNTK